jgi:hypothetical protein
MILEDADSRWEPAEYIKGVLCWSVGEGAVDVEALQESCSFWMIEPSWKCMQVIEFAMGDGE